MKVKSFAKILDEIKPYADYIYLHVKGEPFLHPELASILDLAYTKSFKVNITTNGVLITKVTETILTKQAVRAINFSLHSFEINDPLEKFKYIQEILTFVKKALARTELIISLRLWNLAKIEDNSLRDKNSDILKIIEQELDLPYPIEEKFITGHGITIFDNLYLNYDHEFKWPNLEDESENVSGFCYGLRDQVGILVDGTIVPCCLDGEGVIRLGNIFEQNFSEILDDTRAKNIYNGFSENKAVEELCKKCRYKERFNR